MEMSESNEPPIPELTEKRGVDLPMLLVFALLALVAAATCCPLLLFPDPDVSMVLFGAGMGFPMLIFATCGIVKSLNSVITSQENQP